MKVYVVSCEGEPIGVYPSEEIAKEANKEFNGIEIEPFELDIPTHRNTTLDEQIEAMVDKEAWKEFEMECRMAWELP